MPTARLSCLLALALATGCDGAETPAAVAHEVVQAPPAPPSDEARSALSLARERYQAGDAQAALAAARRAVELAPGWADARMQLGKLLLTLAAVKFGTATDNRTLLGEALLEFEQAHRLAPRDAEASYWWGHGLFLGERYAEAVPQYEHALGIDPQHKLAQKELGLAHAAEGNVAQAKAALQRARELLPQDDEVVFQLGLQLDAEDDVQGAIDALVEAIRLNPAHPGPRTRLVTLYERTGAVNAAQKAAEELAQCKANAKRISQATQRAEKDPRDVAALVEVGQVYLELRMLGAAQSWAARALRVDPENPAAQQLARAIQDEVEAQAMLQRVAPDMDLPGED